MDAYSLTVAEQIGILPVIPLAVALYGSIIGRNLDRKTKVALGMNGWPFLIAYLIAVIASPYTSPDLGLPYVLVYGLSIVGFIISGRAIILHPGNIPYTALNILQFPVYLFMLFLMLMGMSHDWI